MLNPSMQDLMKKVNNRYLLVNLAAQRARDIALNAEAAEEKIPEKPVKIALDEIANGQVAYREGPKPEPEVLSDDIFAAAAEDILLDDVSAEDDMVEEL
ncbi:MAG: DNA-directed RNA polymerase subunit omega [Eubacteriales bacterium]|nr:DNA-directed RNA polymerase subunit omega [Eubacteriales bacterium]